MYKIRVDFTDNERGDYESIDFEVCDTYIKFKNIDSRLSIIPMANIYMASFTYVDETTT